MKTNWFVGILGFVLLVGGYVKSVLMTKPPINLTDMLSVLILVIVGTYLFMSAFLNVLLKWLGKNKKRYYKARNLTSLSQLSFRIKSNAISLATIAILNAMVLTVLGSMWSVYSTQQQAERYYQPFDMQYVAAAEYDAVDGEVDAMIAAYDEDVLVGDMRLVLPRISLDEVGKAYAISQSQFNEAAALTGQAKSVSLQDNEMLFTSQDMYWNVDQDHIKELRGYDTMKFTVNDVEFALKPIDMRRDKITNGFSCGTILVVSNHTFDSIMAQAKDNVAYLRGFVLNDPLGAESMIREIDSRLETDKDFESYVLRYRSAFASLGIALFFAFFIGIMFLVVTGSVLYYKQMAESDNDRKRYQVLSNIGMSAKQISSSVGIQLGIIFGVPFVLGTIDALFALRLLDCMMPQQLMMRAIMIIVIYAVMYSLYFLVTWKNYRKKVLA